MSVKLNKKKELNDNDVAAFAAKLGVLRPVAEVLMTRDVDTVEKAEKFLRPKLSDMQNPFDIKGIKEGVERLKKAIVGDESIVIFGDYDCDGICSIGTLVLELKKTNSKVNYFVPRRDEDGYGLSVAALDAIISNHNPSLIISVDCGISTINEVNYIKSRGIDCIVTDHHEPQGAIPDCIVIDPKVEKKGFYDYCGAGIVFKVIEALKGLDVAMEYSAIVAIATVADMVPLTGDNRIIVHFGLEKLNKPEQLRPIGRGLREFLGIDKITSFNLSTQFIPRINSAGRLGDAGRTLELFFADDESSLATLLEEMNNDNIIRKARCEAIINGAMDKLRDYDLATNRVIVLRDDSWDVGILGIAASKLAELFSRPAILFSGKTGELRGSARSVHSINIFDALSRFKQYYNSFGGHSAAVGLSIKPDSLENFKRDLNEYVKSTACDIAFAPIFVYDAELDSRECTLELTRQLDALEPFGYGNPRPYFKLKDARKINFRPIRNTTHVKARVGDFELMGYNYRNALDVCRGDIGVIFTLHENHYNNKTVPQGVVKTYYMFNAEKLYDDALMMLSVAQISAYDYKFTSHIKVIESREAALQDAMFGTVFVALDADTYLDFLRHTRDNEDFIINNIHFTSVCNPYNRVVLMPGYEYDFRYFNNIVFLNEPISEGYYELVHRLNPKAKLYVFKDAKKQDKAKIIEACPTEAEFDDIFKTVAYLTRSNRTSTRYDIIGLVQKQLPYFSLFKITTCLKALMEAGAVVFSSEKNCFVTNRYYNLDNSEFYNQLKKLKE